MTLERAIVIAAKGHAGVLDKAGAPYIPHPIRVMLAQSTEDARIVGVLHDLVEDCPAWSFERLERKEMFSPVVIKALRLVTKDKGDDHEGFGRYAAFVKRAAGNPISRAVKIADLKDNMDLARIAHPTE